MDKSPDDVIIDAALMHYATYMQNAVIAMSTTVFRLPGGRSLTKEEIKEAWERKDAVWDLISRRTNTRNKT